MGTIDRQGQLPYYTNINRNSRESLEIFLNPGTGQKI